MKFKLVESIDNRLVEEVLDNQGNTITSNQIRYFKNSKVREGEKLIVCYHGSREGSRLTYFDKNKTSYKAIFFSDNLEVAKHFAYGDAEAIYECYLNIINPLKVNAQGKSWFNIQYEDQIVDTSALIAIAQKNGNDGIIIENLIEHDKYRCSDFIIFESNQAKYISNTNPTAVKELDR